MILFIIYMLQFIPHPLINMNVMDLFRTKKFSIILSGMFQKILISLYNFPIFFYRYNNVLSSPPVSNLMKITSVTILFQQPLFMISIKPIGFLLVKKIQNLFNQFNFFKKLFCFQLPFFLNFFKLT